MVFKQFVHLDFLERDVLINVPTNVTVVTTSMVYVILDVIQGGEETTVKRVAFILLKFNIVLSCFDIFILMLFILIKNKFHS